MTDRIQGQLRTGQNMLRDAEDYGRVAVLLGGGAAERDVSLNSGRAVLEALRVSGVNASAIDPKNDSLEDLTQFDRAFIVLHGRGGEDGKIQGYLETIGMPYTGSRVLGSAIAMDKVRSKQLWQAQNTPTPAFVVCDINADAMEVASQLNFPVVVKPANEGSSLGMAKVINSDDLQAAIEAAANFDQQILVEEWIEGAEYTVGILQGQALPAIKIEVANEFYDYDAKYQRDDTRYLCPCGLSPEKETAIRELALTAFSQVSASGWGRVDILCNQATQPYVIEVNTVPGMTDHSLLPKAAAAAGISFTELVMKVLDTSIDENLENSVGAMYVQSGVLGYEQLDKELIGGV